MAKQILMKKKYFCVLFNNFEYFLHRMYFWYKRKRGRREHSLDPANNFEYIGRVDAVFGRRDDGFGGRVTPNNISLTFNAYGDREDDLYHRRSRNSLDMRNIVESDWTVTKRTGFRTVLFCIAFFFFLYSL